MAYCIERPLEPTIGSVFAPLIVIISSKTIFLLTSKLGVEIEKFELEIKACKQYSNLWGS